MQQLLSPQYYTLFPYTTLFRSHLAAAPHFIRADDRHVVLGLTRGDARRAPGARVEVHGHPPPVLAAFALGPQRRPLGRRLGSFVQELVERDRSDDRASFDRVVRLREGELPMSARALDRDA